VDDISVLAPPLLSVSSDGDYLRTGKERDVWLRILPSGSSTGP
jgi:hypothetical protein